MLEVFGQIFGTDSITSTLQGPRKQAATPSRQRRRVFASGKSRQVWRRCKWVGSHNVVVTVLLRVYPLTGV